MEFEFWWLLGFPLFFAFGWLAARIDIKQLLSESRALPLSYFKGLNFLLNEQPDKAIEAFIEVVKVDPQTVELHFALGSLFRRRGEVERAIRMHENLLERADLVPEQKMTALYELAQDYLKAGLLDRAEELFAKLEGTLYEQQGLKFLLEIFEQEKIQTSFFPTGITVQNYPEIFKEIAEQGHEVGTETWIHDYSYMKKRDKEKKDLQKTVEAVKKVVGKAPVGYLSTGVAPSAVTPEIILEFGYTYWMDPQHQETPYTLKLKKKELTVLSYFQDLNDYSSYQRAGRTPRDMLQMWKDCFDCLYEEGAADPKFMMWGNHPFVGGRPFRALLLREFIRYAKGHGKVIVGQVDVIRRTAVERHE